MVSEIVNQDALSYVRSFSNEWFDLIFLDPDYQDWESLIEQGFIWECIRVLKESGNIICFTKQPFDFHLRCAVDKYFRREITWSFDNGGAWVSKQMPLVSFQKIFWLTKSKKFYFNPRTGLDYSENTKDFSRTNKVFGGYKEKGKDFKRSDEGVWIRDHLHFNKPRCGEIPAKPIELIRVLTKVFCEPCGKVLDPFCGYGTVPIVQEEFGNESYCCEIDMERCMNILDRIYEVANGSL